MDLPESPTTPCKPAAPRKQGNYMKDQALLGPELIRAIPYFLLSFRTKMTRSSAAGTVAMPTKISASGKVER